MQRLRDAGNTLVVVEHDPAVMLAADRMIDMGPGPGERGGQIVFDGTTDALRDADTLTGAYLGGRKQVGMGFKRAVTDAHAAPHPGRRARAQPAERDGRVSAAAAGLRHRRLRLGQVQPDPGRAGAGADAPLRQGHRDAGRARPHAGRRPPERRGVRRPVADRQDRALQPGQLRRRLGRDPRDLRHRARWRGSAATPRSKFSFNSGDGRCPTCGGSGFEHVEMQFLSDVYLRCPDCDGKRYRPEILEVTIERSAGARRSTWPTCSISR